MTSPTMLHRPIYGGVFGHGRYSLATMPTVSRGLHAVRFMVIERAAGAVLSIAEEKREALARARLVLRSDADTTQGWEQSALWRVDELPIATPSVVTPRSVSRRRRAIFEKSNGRCHYCHTVLTLDGKWHVEHMVPRALLGKDEPLNLVASCCSCNLAKRDRSALEYVLETTRLHGV